MKFAKLVFLVAGIYGLIVMLPQYFLEDKTSRDFPPPITHPEFYYGFIGVTVAWQLLFLILSSNPERYRPMMIPAILEKALFPLAIVILFSASSFALDAGLRDCRCTSRRFVRNSVCQNAYAQRGFA